MAENTTSYKRLRRELVEITKDPPPKCTAGVADDNLYKWVATITGPDDTPYKGGGGLFKLAVSFPANYPLVPPKRTEGGIVYPGPNGTSVKWEQRLADKVKFITKIFHCNISKEGTIFLDILKDDKWSPAITVGKLLLSIASLLADCNPGDPLVPSIAMLYTHNRTEHDMRAEMWTRRYAK